MSHGRRPPGLDAGLEPEPGHYGCPMLTRTRMGRANGQPLAMRCSLGWALHNRLEAARCLATDDLTDCWKVHPERTPAVPVMAEALSAADD